MYIENNQKILFRLIEEIIKFNKNISIRTIIEVGARDCNESVNFNNQYSDSHIYAFECNPEMLPICRDTIKDFNRITLVESAVSDTNDDITFYAIDKENTISSWSDKNPGASSLFKASGKYPVEQYAQKEVHVKSTRLDKFLNKNSIKEIDILWMDIQGAELLALTGLAERIEDIFLIHCEVEFFEIYKDQPLFKEIKKFLKKKNFELLGFTYANEYSGDAVFVNKNKIQEIDIEKIKNSRILKKRTTSQIVRSYILSIIK